MSAEAGRAMAGSERRDEPTQNGRPRMLRETPTGAPIDRGNRQGNIWLLLLLALLLLGAALATTMLDADQYPRFVLWFLGAFAFLGVWSVFLYAIGVLQIALRADRNDLTKLIVDTAREGHVVVSRDGGILYANGAYQELCAQAGGEVRPVERLFNGAADVTEACYRLAQAAREGRSAAEEIRVVPALGGKADVGWYRVRVRTLDRAGKRVSYWSVADVTREREGQENVFQELQHAIDYLDHAPAGFFSVDPDGRIAYLNATLAAWLDLDIAQHGPGALKLADITTGDGEALLRAVSGSPGSIRNEVLDLDLKRSGGRSLPVRLFHRVAFAADGTAGPSRTLVLNRSQGEEAAEGLRAAEVRLARFFNNTPLALATLDAEGRLQRANAPFARMFAAILGQGADKEKVERVVVDEDREKFRAALVRAFEGKGDIAPVDATLRGEGGKRNARFFFSAVEGRDSDEEAALIYALETTEQNKLQEQLVQATKMNAVGQLAGGVAHDFNNHLQAIIGFADLLLANYRSTDPRFQDVMQIKGAANRATALIRQLLAFSRQQTLRPETIPLGDQLSNLSAMLRRAIGPKVELDVRHGRDLWPVFCDPTSFDNMIINLSVNARDAMPEGGKLTVRTANITTEEAGRLDQEAMAPADYVLIEVTDTGTGMSEDVREKIFEPFFTTKEVGRGTGLGLSSVYGFVKQSGGFIFCDSTLGEGSTFRIYLPRHIPKATEVEKAVAEKTAQTDLTGHGTILLVEDEDTVRAFSARGLSQRGFTVVQACSGADALEKVDGKVEGIDLVVSDVVMPEMDGPTLLKELRQRNPSLKVIFVSGYAEEAFRKNLPEGQQFDFLAKPFNLKQLLEKVKEVMG